MDPIILSLALVLVLVAIGATVLFLRRRRTDALQSRFGPEYKRAVEQTGDRHKAEAQLHDLEKRVEALSIRPLAREDRERFVEAWRQVQANFVDEPKVAVMRADDLLGEVMGARGYPVSDFEQRSADLSVDHPTVVQNYRAAHDIALRHGRGEASTEDLRQAMIHYRMLFDDLVNEPEQAPAKAAS